MADISVTASAVQLKVESVSGSVRDVVYGESVTPGQLLYQNSSDTLYYKSDADASGKKQVEVLALTPGGANDPGVVAGPGAYVKLGSGVMTKGVAYFMSKTAGGICPQADVTSSGTAVSIAGVAYDTDTLYFRPINTGISL